MFRFVGILLGLGLSASALANPAVAPSQIITVARDTADLNKFCVSKMVANDSGLFENVETRRISDYKVQGWMWDEDITEDPFFYEMDESAVVGFVGGVAYSGYKWHEYTKTPMLHVSHLKHGVGRFKQVDRWIKRASELDAPHRTLTKIGDDFINLSIETKALGKKIVGLGKLSGEASKAGLISDLKMIQTQILANNFGKTFELTKKFAKAPVIGAAGAAVLAGVLAGLHKTIFKADVRAMSQMSEEQAQELFEISSPLQEGQCKI